MPDYKSSVLKCNPEEDGCPVCEFLKGKHTIENILEVIRILDDKLDEEERLTETLTELLISKEQS